MESAVDEVLKSDVSIDTAIKQTSQSVDWEKSESITV